MFPNSTISRRGKRNPVERTLPMPRVTESKTRACDDLTSPHVDAKAAAQAPHSLDRAFCLLRVTVAHAMKLQDHLDQWFMNVGSVTSASSPALAEPRAARAASYLGWLERAQAGGAELLRRAAQSGRPNLEREIQLRAEELCGCAVAMLEADVQALSRWQMEAMQSWGQFLRDEGIDLQTTTPATAMTPDAWDDESSCAVADGAD